MAGQVAGLFSKTMHAATVRIRPDAPVASSGTIFRALRSKEA